MGLGLNAAKFVLKVAGTLINATFIGGTENVNALTSSTTIEVDFDLGPQHEVTLAHNTTWSTANSADGKSASVRVLIDGTGTRTQAFPGAWVPIGDVTPNTAADKTNNLEIWVVDGVTHYEIEAEA